MSYNVIKKVRIVPVVKLDSASDAVKVVEALSAGGIPIAEITFRTAAAPEAITLAAENCPDALIGAGTVINAAQAETAVKCGAKFIVSPGYSEAVNAFCHEAGILYVPGAVTPTEIMKVVDGGNSIVKFFPASVYGGVKALKALGAPFTDVVFIPTGGVDNENLKEYLSLKNVLAAGGSWMVKDSLIKSGNFAEITRISRIGADIVKEI